MRISVSEIDSYRYWKGNEDVPLEKLLSDLRKKDPPSQDMLAGRALHKIMETANEGEIKFAEMDGFTFDFALDEPLSIPPIRELKGEIEIEGVTLVGVVDGFDGVTVNDYKLTGQFNAEKYIDSYQWRAYLMMFGANRFMYNVFVAAARLELLACHRNKHKEFQGKKRIIHQLHNLPLFGYLGMESDVTREVLGLADIIKRFIPERL